MTLAWRLSEVWCDRPDAGRLVSLDPRSHSVSVNEVLEMVSIDENPTSDRFEGPMARV
jgi:hypothetical protein